MDKIETSFVTNTKNKELKFEIFIEDFDKKDQKMATDFNSIYNFWCFCSNLHNSIDWKSNMDILKFLLVSFPIC